MGTLRTGLLLAGLTALFLAAGFLLGGEGGGMMIALVVALAMNVFAYWNSDKLVLRMYGAREVDAGCPALRGPSRNPTKVSSPPYRGETELRSES